MLLFHALLINVNLNLVLFFTVFPRCCYKFTLLFIYYNYFLVTEMSKQSGIKSFFKVKTANEIEVEELMLTQISRASRATTLETTKSISTISCTKYFEWLHCFVTPCYISFKPLCQRYKVVVVNGMPKICVW